MGQAESSVFSNLEKNSNCTSAWREVCSMLTLSSFPPRLTHDLRVTGQRTMTRLRATFPISRRLHLSSPLRLTPPTYVLPFSPSPTSLPCATLLTHVSSHFALPPAVSAPELLRLKKRFMKLDKDGSGSIDKDEFLQIPQIATNPLAHRMIAIFDEE